MNSKKYTQLFFVIFFILSLPYLLYNDTDPVTWIGGCNPGGYDDDHYMAFCSTYNYGRYERWAFLNAMEHGIEYPLKNAKILFLGNSRLQYAFSLQSVQDYFNQLSVSHYLMGFTSEKVQFTQLLMNKMNLHPKLLVINTDDFFEPIRKDADPDNADIIYLLKKDWIVSFRYQWKKIMQNIQHDLCQNNRYKWLTDIVKFCADGPAMYRSISNGHWLSDYHDKDLLSENIKYKVNYNMVVDKIGIDKSKNLAINFIKDVNTPKECIILTTVPSKNANIKLGQALASLLDLNGIFINQLDLHTFDNSHLTKADAEKWSGLFLEKLMPYIRKCIVQNN